MQKVRSLKVASNMHKFWDEFHESVPNIVLIELDRLGYFELNLIRDLKSMNSKICFIGLSHSPDAYLRKQYLEGGIDYVLNGPVEFTNIPEIMSNYVTTMNLVT